MISYPAVCTKACGVGMSLGGVFTTWLAASQLAETPPGRPRFSASVYFSVAAGLQIVLWVVVMMLEGRLAKCLDAWGGMPAAFADTLLPGTFSKQRTTSDPFELKSASRFALGALFCGCFMVHAMTYTVPSLMPFVASSCASHGVEQQILLWMLVCQQAGETAGRMLAPVGRAKLVLPSIGAVYFIIVFIIFFALAVWPEMLENSGIIDCSVAMPVLPMMCFGFFCSFGVMQTFIFLSARRLASEKSEKELLASDMGFLGQMGSLTANLIAFAVVNLD